MLDLTTSLDVTSVQPLEDNVLYGKFVVSKPLYDAIRNHSGTFYVLG